MIKLHTDKAMIVVNNHDYVHWIWQYKVINMKSHLRVKIIWDKHNMQNPTLCKSPASSYGGSYAVS